MSGNRLGRMKLINCGYLASLITLIVIGCTSKPALNSPFELYDDQLEIELIASDPDIVTPIGLAIDSQDAIYVLESHTHSPPSDYPGPSYDKIKKGIDDNGDGIPDTWIVFADSIVNGVNLAIDEDGSIYLTTKNQVLLFRDNNGDNISDEKQTLLSMTLPESIYVHAGILGITIGPDGWIYVSRGNLGSKFWRIEGSDNKILEGYGIGGVVMRCKKDGSQLELVASGFWNPFDLKFTHEGRLFLTDNDPDSRGPNRLIEIVPGGDYGYKCLYGGSGIHPYQSWNGELPGSLPYAAALGEAPCALIDARETNFGDDYRNNILVNVWEERNIVRIPLRSYGSTLIGETEVLLQGDSTFHPVALATDSKGNLYISDWVVREYPNHGEGKIWRLSSKDQSTSPSDEPGDKINRFADNDLNQEELMEMLLFGDNFQKATARSVLNTPTNANDIISLTESEDPTLRLQAILILTKSELTVEKNILEKLLMDSDPNIRRMTLIYIGSKLRTDMQDVLENTLANGLIGSGLFETYLATIQHLQSEFINNYTSKSGISADKVKQKLPELYIETLIGNKAIPEAARAIALSYLDQPQGQKELLLSLLDKASNNQFKMGLTKALKQSNGNDVAKKMIDIALDKSEDPALRTLALSLLNHQTTTYFKEASKLLLEDNPALQYAAVKYLCRCKNDAELKGEIDALVNQIENTATQSAWKKCTSKSENQPGSIDQWASAVNDTGLIERGKLVFESATAQCLTCHQVDGWGGTYGPNLSNVGNSKSSSQLVNAVLDPSLEISPEWQGWFITDQDGNDHIGRQIDVHQNGAELMNQNGEFDYYDKPRAYGVMSASLMPAGLQNSMTSEEFNDLIAYLKSLN